MSKKVTRKIVRIFFIIKFSLFFLYKKILSELFKATLNFQNIKMALNNFFKICHKWYHKHADHNSTIKNGVTKLIFDLLALKAKNIIKKVRKWPQLVDQRLSIYFIP